MVTNEFCAIFANVEIDCLQLIINVDNNMFLRFGCATSIAEGARIEAPLAPRGVKCREGVPPSLLAVPPPQKFFGLFNVKMAYLGVYLRYSEVFILKHWFATQSCKSGGYCILRRSARTLNDFSETNYLKICWTIFAIFMSNESFLGVDNRSGPLISISQGTLPWQPILCINWQTLHFHRSGIQKWYDVTPCMGRIK